MILPLFDLDFFIISFVVVLVQNVLPDVYPTAWVFRLLGHSTNIGVGDSLARAFYLLRRGALLTMLLAGESEERRLTPSKNTVSKIQLPLTNPQTRKV